MAHWEKWRFSIYVAKREAELAKQQKEKVEKMATMLQPISVHRQKKIHEKEQKNLPIRYHKTKTDQHNLWPTCLPPISKAAQATLAAKDSTGGGFGPAFSMERSNYLSADTRKLPTAQIFQG